MVLGCQFFFNLPISFLLPILPQFYHFRQIQERKAPEEKSQQPTLKLHVHECAWVCVSVHECACVSTHTRILMPFSIFLNTSFHSSACVKCGFSLAYVILWYENQPLNNSELQVTLNQPKLHFQFSLLEQSSGPLTDLKILLPFVLLNWASDFYFLKGHLNFFSNVYLTSFTATPLIFKMFVWMSFQMK